MHKHYVDFFSPGTFFSEVTRREIDSWNVEKAVELADEVSERHGATPYGFRFVTKSRGPDDLDAKDTVHSGMYFLGGTLYDIEELRGNDKYTTLVSNLEGMDATKCLVNDNSWLIHQPFFEDKDVLLEYIPPKKRKKDADN